MGTKYDYSSDIRNGARSGAIIGWGPKETHLPSTNGRDSGGSGKVTQVKPWLQKRWQL